MIKFGTGGFRGIIGEDFTKENLQRIALGLSSLYKKEKLKSPILIGYDFRFLSLEASRWMAEAFASKNIKVLISNQALTTPAVLYKTKVMGNDYSIMITASHNPYNNNGVKLIQKGGQDASKELTDRLEKEISKIKEPMESFSYESGITEGLINETDILSDYLSFVRSFIDVNEESKPLRILIDPFYGTGVLTLKPILESMGFHNIDVIDDKRDAFFGGLVPNPTPENMKKNASVVKRKYDICIGTDSDCDRLAILDEKGKYVDAHTILALIDYYLVKYRKEQGAVVKNEATSQFIDKVAQKLDQRCLTVPVGFKNVSQKMKEEDALLGGEGSGGLTIRGYLLGKDSTFSAALFLEMLSKMKKSVSEIVKEVKDFASYQDSFFEGYTKYTSKRKDIMKMLWTYLPFDGKTADELLMTDYEKEYIRYEFDGNLGTILLRFSGTEKVIRYYMETGKTEKVFQSNFKAFKKLIEGFDKNPDDYDCEPIPEEIEI